MRPSPRRANVDTMCILLYQDVTMQKGSCSPFFRCYYGRVGLLLHLHPAFTHAATGYWPYDMLTNIPIFSKDRLSTLLRLDQSPRKVYSSVHLVDASKWWALHGYECKYLTILLDINLSYFFGNRIVPRKEYEENRRE